MSFTAAIDISTFIWCEQDFKKNTQQYHTLLGTISSVYEKIKELKLPILFRDKLERLIWAEFPYNMARTVNPDFETSTLQFLTETFSNWVEYDDNNNSTITSVPVLVKSHFNGNSKMELQSQINHIFKNDENHKFISFLYFYNHDQNLLLSRGREKKEIETFCYSSDKEILEFFNQYKIKFEHNSKHRKEGYYDHDRKEDVSPFSCFHYQGEVEAQKLLDEAFFLEGCYYNFDLNNHVYVRFRNTRGLIFHGHDLSDKGDNIPNVVKKKYSKNGRIF